MTTDFVTIAGQAGPGVIVALIAFYYADRTYREHAKTIKSMQNDFNGIIKDHLRNAASAQREDAKAKVELSLELQKLSDSHKDLQDVMQTLYKELVRVKKPELFKKITV